MWLIVGHRLLFLSFRDSLCDQQSNSNSLGSACTIRVIVKKKFVMRTEFFMVYMKSYALA